MSHSLNLNLFMLSDKTPFGLHHNSCVILNLKAAEGSSRELTRQSLVDIEEDGTNVLGTVRKGNKIVYVMATYSTELQTGNIITDVTLYGDKEMFRVDNTNEDEYNFSEIFGNKFSCFKGTVHEKRSCL